MSNKDYKGPTVDKPTELPPPPPNCGLNQYNHDPVLNLQARTMWISRYEEAAGELERLMMENAALQQAIRDQDANEHCIRELKNEIVELLIERIRLREALKQARRFASDNHYTMREFAEYLGITPTQLSAWTDEIPNREPDFKD